MTTKSTLASVHVAAPLPALSLRQVLLVHLIVFQEALFGYHIYEFSSIEWIQEKLGSNFPVGLLTYDYGPSLRRPDTVRLSSDWVYRAFIMLNNCDTFCAIMQRFVDRHLNELLGLSNPTVWTSFLAIPQLRLVTDMDELSKLIGHSCLLVTDANGVEHMFDGTIDQYGRDWKTHWLMTKAELMGSHMYLNGGFRRWTEEDMVTTRAELEGWKWHGYWAVASRRIEQIFQEFDWMSILGCTEDDIETRIRSLSKAGFVDAFADALAQKDKPL